MIAPALKRELPFRIARHLEDHLSGYGTLNIVSSDATESNQPPVLAAMHEQLREDFPPVIEDRALEGELRLCLKRIADQHWRLHA